MNSSFKNKHQAFTLIELLVVIAIIAVLASLLMPGISKARDGVRSSVCISNLKQLGAAMYSFASDHEGKLPPVSVNIQDDAGKNYARELFGGIPQWWSDKELLGQYLANNKGYGAVAEPSPLVCLRSSENRLLGQCCAELWLQYADLYASFRLWFSRSCWVSLGTTAF